MKMKIKDLELHEAVELYPVMQKEEFEALKISIKERGISVPLTLCNNKVIDGRHRLAAAKELKLKEVPVEVINDLTEEQIIDFVNDRNLTHRHLTAGQRVLVVFGQLSKTNFEGKFTPEIKKRRKGSLAKVVAEKAMASEKAVKMVQYILSNGSPEELELLNNGETINKVHGIIKKRLKPTPAAKTDSTSNITTTIVEKGVVNKNNNAYVAIDTFTVDSDKVAFILKHGNDIQRMAVKNKPEAATAIYNSITTKQDQASIPPTPMPTIVPPSVPPSVPPIVYEDDWKVKYDDLWIKYEKLLSICTDLETEVMELKGDVVQKDYTQLKGQDITPEELDKVGLAFTDHPTYVRLMKEHEAHRMAEYKKGFKD